MSIPVAKGQPAKRELAYSRYGSPWLGLGLGLGLGSGLGLGRIGVLEVQLALAHTWVSERVSE